MDDDTHDSALRDAVDRAVLLKRQLDAISASLDVVMDIAGDMVADATDDAVQYAIATSREASLPRRMALSREWERRKVQMVMQRQRREAESLEPGVVYPLERIDRPRGSFPDGYFVYRLHDEHGVIFYIGQTGRLHGRLRSHFYRFPDELHGFSFMPCESREAALELERANIRIHKPRENVMHNDAAGRG